MKIKIKNAKYAKYASACISVIVALAVSRKLSLTQCLPALSHAITVIYDCRNATTHTSVYINGCYIYAIYLEVYILHLHPRAYERVCIRLFDVIISRILQQISYWCCCVKRIAEANLQWTYTNLRNCIHIVVCDYMDLKLLNNVISVAIILWQWLDHVERNTLIISLKKEAGRVGNKSNEPPCNVMESEKSQNQAPFVKQHNIISRKFNNITIHRIILNLNASHAILKKKIASHHIMA